MFPRGQTEPRQRIASLVESLINTGRLSGALRIPNTVGDLMIEANLRSRRLTASLDVAAPQDKGARGRVSWLVNQLAEAPGHLLIEVYPAHARTPTSATLDQTLEDRLAPLDESKKEPNRFRLVLRSDMGMGRGAAKKSPGFITTVLQLMNTFYGDVVQNVAAWQPPAPKLAKPPVPTPEAEEKNVQEDPQTFYTRPWWESQGSSTPGA